ncbi:leucine-rich repeat domain-containing protein [Periweissella cryptocerci]|uniref:Leucine-rich repeat domain-containing protein n=1 Tax=Periweissella cryptocerci TaxID=2506420 RepID=A0A4P6YV48_9LACO|nr:leucine-rich repeat domain-containing protein [Periweissella cryptocerci]QBO36577.1 leucine-rich repeat domain-containing protein [Periweissella cryptocerci]
MKLTKLVTLGMASMLLFSVGAGPVSALAATPKSQTIQRSSPAFIELIPDAGLRQAIIQYGKTLTVEIDLDGYDDEIFKPLSDEQKKVLTNDQATNVQIKNVLKTVEVLLVSWSNEASAPAKISDLTGLNNLPNLKYLDLDGQNITAINSTTFNGLSKLINLGLGNNKITTIPANTFSNVSNLENLDLEFNKITSLGTSSFNGLSKLQRLSLDANQLTSLAPNVFVSLKQLTSLELSNNQLKNLVAGTFKGLSNLETLDLDNNQLTTIAQGTLSGLSHLLNLGLYGNANLIDYAALADLPLKSQYIEATLDPDLVMAWYHAVLQAGDLLGTQSVIPIPSGYTGNLNDVINVAKYQQILQGKGGDSQVIVNLREATVIANDAGVKACISRLQAAINTGEVMQLPSLLAAVYVAVDKSITALENNIIGNIGSEGKNDKAVLDAKAAIKAVNQAHVYGNLDQAFSDLRTAVTKYKTHVTTNAQNAINQAKNKKFDQSTVIRPVITKLQASIKAQQYDEMITLTKQLNTLVGQTKRVKTALKLDTAYHKNNYITGSTAKGTQVIIKDAKTKRQVGSGKANAKGKFKVKVKKLKGRQKLTVTVDQADTAKVIYQATSKNISIKTSPKPKATNFKVNKQRVTGVATKGTTIRVYKGQKLIKKVRVKNTKVKFNLKKKYQKKTKLKIKVQHTHAKGFGVRQFSIRVK